MLARKIFKKAYYAWYGKNGKRITINNEDYVVSAYVARGIPQTIDDIPLRLLKNLSRNAEVLVDIGGNIGTIATIIAKHMRSGVIYSFEPAPSTFRILKDTARVQKGNARIHAFQYAISNKAETLAFTNMQRHATNHTTLSRDENSTMVPAITLDSFCDSKKIVPEVIKVDIEGAEYWALEGMKETLMGNDCKVLVEIHTIQLGEYGINGKQFADLINSIGYKAYDAAGRQIDNEQIINTPCVILSKKPVPVEVFSIN